MHWHKWRLARQPEGGGGWVGVLGDPSGMSKSMLIKWDLLHTRCRSESASALAPAPVTCECGLCNIRVTYT